MTGEKITFFFFFVTANLGCQPALLSAQLKLELGAQRGKAFPARDRVPASVPGPRGLALARNPIAAAANATIAKWWQKGALGQGQRPSSGTNLSRATRRANGDGG